MYTNLDLTLGSCKILKGSFRVVARARRRVWARGSFSGARARVHYERKERLYTYILFTRTRACTRARHHSE